jgi:hypothetical protein
MSSPLHVWPQDWPELARTRFNFSPPILGIAPNEWTLRLVTLNEVVVRNAVTQDELSIPRRLLGDISGLEEQVRVVRLLKRLEYAEGLVRPVNRAVIAMPPAADFPRIRAAHPATVVAIREDAVRAPRWKHYLRISVALGCLACFVAVYVFREGRSARVRRFSARPSRLLPHPPASIQQVPLERR